MADCKDFIPVPVTFLHDLDGAIIPVQFPATMFVVQVAPHIANHLVVTDVRSSSMWDNQSLSVVLGGLPFGVAPERLSSTAVKAPFHSSPSGNSIEVDQVRTCMRSSASSQSWYLARSAFWGNAFRCSTRVRRSSKNSRFLRAMHDIISSKKIFFKRYLTGIKRFTDPQFN
jgi:hypothetical protein